MAEKRILVYRLVGRSSIKIRPCNEFLTTMLFAPSSLLLPPSLPPLFLPSVSLKQDVDRAADARGLEKNVSYHNISMGQGQDVVAMNCLEMGHKQGHWTILNNVHLMPQWLVELEKKLDAFNIEGSHERMRVFLSSDPAKDIPIGILSRCIKLTNEPPTGLKANLKRAYVDKRRDAPTRDNDGEKRRRDMIGEAKRRGVENDYVYLHSSPLPSSLSHLPLSWCTSSSLPPPPPLLVPSSFPLPSSRCLFSHLPPPLRYFSSSFSSFSLPDPKVRIVRQGHDRRGRR